MYSVAKGSGATLTITLSAQSSAGAIALPTVTIPVSANVAAQSYFQLPATGVTSTTTTSSSSWSGVYVIIKSARLTGPSGQLWDFAFSPYFGTAQPTATATVNTTTVQSIAVEANDPRCNLRPSDWTWSSAWSTGLVGTLGKTNSVCKPNPDATGATADIATDATDPWQVSSAYIRNGPMQSLWELGNISRGRPWQTLNLAKYSGQTSMGDTYSAGDADILDQVKLGSQVIDPGKVNVNTRSTNVLAALLKRIRVGQSFSQLGTSTGGTLLTTANALAIAGSASSTNTDSTTWLYMNGAANDTAPAAPFRHRGQLATIANLQDGTCGTTQTNKAAMEEIIGKIANLCTTRPNYFIVIVDAQAIKDLPTGVLGGTRGIYDPGVDKILAERKAMAIFRRDAYWNNIRLLRYEYLDE